MATKKTEAVEPKKTEAPNTVIKKTTEPKQTIYIGPGIRGVISKNHTYAEAPSTDEINRIATKASVPYGCVEALIVPVTELAKAMVDLNDPQSKLSICYKKIIER